MRFSPSIETQLAAAASAADRANRPRLFVVAPAVLLVGAIVISLLAYQRFAYAKNLLFDRLAEQEVVHELIAFAEKLEEAHPDPGDLFPINDFMDANIDDIAKEIWEGDGPVTVSGKSKPRAAGLTRQVDRSDVDVAFSAPVSLTDVFEFIHRVLTDEPLKGVFLAKFDLRPTHGGWVGSVRFRLYERAR